MSIIIPGSFPARRLRRSRTHSFSRRLVAENQLTVDDLILPVFIIEGQNLRQEVPSMPGVFRLSVDMLLHDAAQFVQAGIPAIALFPCIESSAKSLMADASWDPSGLVPRAVRALKKAFPELGVMTLLLTPIRHMVRTASLTKMDMYLMSRQKKFSPDRRLPTPKQAQILSLQAT